MPRKPATQRTKSAAHSAHNHLDPVGMARFLQQTEDGHGDYTKEKYSAPEPTWEELRADLKRLDALPG